ncbi:MAG: hypothetical protein HKN73_16710 [Gemmatimonadetes bacterium]|nr:hypothetical protein [Gemmatimonadota bacterium]
MPELNFLRDVVAPAGRGDLAAVRRLVSERPAWIHTHGSHGRTMLWEAAYRGKLPVVRFLVECGADLEAYGSHYSPHLVDISPYCVARYHRRERVADFLLEAGADVTLHSSAYLGLTGDVERALDEDPSLLTRGHPQTYWVDGKVRPRNHRYRMEPWATPLVFAVAGAQPETFEALLHRGASTHSVEDRLLEFAKHRSERSPKLLAQVLRSLGRKPLSEPVQEEGDLVYLCRGDRGGDPDEVRRLLARGSRVGERDAVGRTPLHNAARGGLVPAMVVLLEHGADPNATDSNGETPLHAAVRTRVRRLERSLAAVRLLVEHGADPSRPDADGVTVRQAAHRSRRVDREQVLEILE